MDQTPTVQKSPCLPRFTHKAFWMSATISINTPAQNNIANAISKGVKSGLFTCDEFTKSIGRDIRNTQNACAIQNTKKRRGCGCPPPFPRTSSNLESPLRSCARHARNSSNHPREHMKETVTSILRGSFTQFKGASPIDPATALHRAITR